jgi:hypothetical protein
MRYEEVNKMQQMSTIRKEFVVCHIKFQLNRLFSLMRNIEDSRHLDSGYAFEALKAVEGSLRQIRKVCTVN